MGLDNATVKEFANLINPFDKTSGEATVYGRVVGFNEIGGRPIVNLDGSTQNIPIRTTVKVKGPKGSQGDQDYYAGDRVLVRIKNHEALIVSNISTQMTTAEGAEDAAKQYVSDNGFIYAEKISGQQGDFYTLSSDKFSATQITGALGHFITVNADRIITDAINAQIANIDTIKASDVVAGEGDFAYLNVDNVLDAKMANLDTANINKANIGSLLAEMGLISSATIVEGHVTGYLDSVEVNANKITAGTLLVDRLYIKDQNNKWKMQTVDGQGQTVYVEAADRINERTITADKLVAHSITTDELNATNITANNSSFMESLTNSLTTNYLFATQANVQDLVAHSVDAELAELDILNINEELKTQNIHLGEIVFDQPTKPSVMPGNPDYILGIERETKTISAYDDTSLYSEGDYVTHYYSKDNMMVYPYDQKTHTQRGITFTDNGDGSITCNGTKTESTVAQFYPIVDSKYGQFGYNISKFETGKKYILTGCPSGGSETTYQLRLILNYDRSSEGLKQYIYIDRGDGIEFTISSEIKYARLMIDIFGSDTTVNDLVFYPKIRLATNEDANWYPFIKGVYKCIEPITTAELWDENKWYYLRDAVSGDQYEFDHVRYSEIDSLTSIMLNTFYPIGSLYLTIDPNINPSVLFGGTWVIVNDSGNAILLSASSNNKEIGASGSNSKTLSADQLPNHFHYSTDTRVQSWSVNNTTLNYNQSGLRSHNHRQYHHCAGGNCSDNLASGDTYASSFNWNPTNWSFCPDTGNWNAAASHGHSMNFVDKTISAILPSEYAGRGTEDRVFRFTNQRNYTYNTSQSSLDVSPRKYSVIVWKRTA